MNYAEPGYVESGYFTLDSDTVGDFTFDGYGRFIFVAAVASISIQTMYSRWADWQAVINPQGYNSKWTPAMRYTGFDPIPGGFTGATYFLINGWRMIYDAHATAVSGVLFSDDFLTPFYDPILTPFYPVTVAAIVNSAVVYQNVVTGVALTPTETANAVWNANTAAHLAAGTTGNMLTDTNETTHTTLAVSV